MELPELFSSRFKVKNRFRVLTLVNVALGEFTPVNITRVIK